MRDLCSFHSFFFSIFYEFCLSSSSMQMTIEGFISISLMYMSIFTFIISKENYWCNLWDSL